MLFLAFVMLNDHGISGHVFLISGHVFLISGHVGPHRFGPCLSKWCGLEHTVISVILKCLCYNVQHVEILKFET